MSRHGKPTPPVRAARNAARLEIIQAANRYMIGARRRRSLFDPASLFGSRQIQQAVSVARQHHLFDDVTLATAGFRPARHRVDVVQLLRKAA